MTKLVYIYILIDPITNKIRYVGQSTNPIQRYHGHLTLESPLTDWIENLRNLKEKPLLKIIDACIQDKALSTEMNWFAYLVGENHPLLNGNSEYDNFDKSHKPIPLKNLPKNMIRLLPFRVPEIS